VTKPIEKALTKIPNRFLLTTVVARRWENLVAGAPPLVDNYGLSLIETAFDEVVRERIRIDEVNLRIELEGTPQVEEHNEPLYSAALPTDAEDLKNAVAEDRSGSES
jgi:DNA-directed RNA polymerase subunit K/omega